ncbi:MAG: hypothetical protein ACE5OW_04305, partial [Candidatus Bathyarchaeia archaeon]
RPCWKACGPAGPRGFESHSRRQTTRITFKSSVARVKNLIKNLISICSMLLVTVAAVILLVLAVDNAYEFSSVYKARRRDKASMLEAHSRVVEAGELFGFILAGILLYLSVLDIIAVIVLILVDLYHLGGALTTKQYFSQFSQERLRRFLTVPMAVCFVEVVVAVSVVVWMASNGWIGL